jgi:DNA/RNA-binding domain of Phe-tRNA-synthetase-like protein
MNSNYEMNDSDLIIRALPGARIGVMALELLPWKESSLEMNGITEEVILSLKEKYPEPISLKKNEVIEAYSMYYKRFKKTYHLIPQLESVIFHDKKINSPISLLQAVFTTELKNMLLTAVHDLDAIQFPITIGLASGEEKYQLLNGSETFTKSGDMYMSDQSGVISSIIYGPDLRTKVTRKTSNVLIVVYTPDGIGAERVECHFEDILSMMDLISEDPKLRGKRIFPEN